MIPPYKVESILRDFGYPREGFALSLLLAGSVVACGGVLVAMDRNYSK
ncbi:MAG: hypothetical protein PHF56_13245 [Desulfuromonadaceae bacterium]|nr:hypothetical protein [Desulfuromonadaceae bacterium]